MSDFKYEPRKYDLVTNDIGDPLGTNVWFVVELISADLQIYARRRSYRDPACWLSPGRYMPITAAHKDTRPGTLVRVPDSDHLARVNVGNHPLYTVFDPLMTKRSVVGCYSKDRLVVVHEDAIENAGIDFKPVRGAHGVLITAELSQAPAKWVLPTGPTCPHCQSAIYIGLLTTECPKGCDVMARPEPPVPETTPVYSISLREALWSAYGRGHEVLHPLREEAIRLWQELVRTA